MHGEEIFFFSSSLGVVGDEAIDVTSSFFSFSGSEKGYSFFFVHR